MISLGDVAIMGGGCYGTFYLDQLVTARAKGAVSFRQLFVVDRDPGCPAAAHMPPDAGAVVASDWNAFLDGWLVPARRDRDGLPDMIVPTPLMPHLMAQWLERRARREWPLRSVSLVPVTTPVGTPYDRTGSDGVRYVSFADWLCPVHCIEPLLCPAIKAPRTWEMGDTIAEWSEGLRRDRPTADPALFTCRHVVHGVGMFPVRAAFDALGAFRPIAASPVGGDLAIGSISACHGAIALLRVGPEPEAAADVLYSRDD